MFKHIFVATVVLFSALLAGGGFFLSNQSYFSTSSNSQNSVPEASTAPVASIPTSADNRVIAESYGKLPLHFEPNVGQTSDAVDFLARGNGYTLFLNRSGAVVSLIKDGTQGVRTAVRMTLENANEGASGCGTEAQSGTSNYFIGNDAAKWRSEVPNYAKVQYDDVYPGVDLVYYGNNHQLEYDLVVEPNSDPSQIRLKFAGMDKAAIDHSSGDLLLATAAGTLRQHAPVAYQNIDGERREIASSYRLNGDTVGISLGEYDRSHELVIDPVLAYGTYLGGNAFDEGRSITVDAQGNAYVVGTAASLDFPTTAGTIKPVLGASNNNQYWYDAFVSKINPTGTALVFSTYFGGANGSETGTGVALDATGNVLISGTTMANDLPVVNAYQSTFGGTDDSFAAKINPNGTAIIYSTYLGGNNTDTGGRVTVNQATGTAVFAGYTSSGNFPTTPGAFKPQLCDGSPGSCNGIFYSGGYVVKLSSTGSAVYSTLFDASIQDIALDSSDNATFAGSASSGFATTPGAYQPANSGGIDGFIAKLDPTGHTQVYGTFLGGGLQSDVVRGIVLDATDTIYVTGKTENTGFPVTAGAYDQTYNGGGDGFISKLDPSGSTLLLSTFVGGLGNDQPSAIAFDQDHNLFIAGETTGGTSYPLRNSLNSTGSIFLTRMTADGASLIYSSLLGAGGAYDLAVDTAGAAYVTGNTTAVLVTPDAFQTVRNRNPSNITAKDAFILKLAPADENATYFNISGTVTDENYGYNNDYTPIVVTITGAANRSINIAYSGGTYYFGALPAGGTYTVTVSKIGYVTAPENAVFTNLGANQSADFTILRNHAPEGTITAPVQGAVFNAGTPINIQATASDPDGDPIQKVDFVAYSSSTGSLAIGTDTTAPYETTWTNAPVGTWSLYAFPTDSHGLRGDSIEIVQIQVVNSAPLSVSILSPTNGQVLVEGDYVPIQVSVLASVNLVEVRDQNNNLVAWLTGSPWSSFWRVMDVGEYTLTATAHNSQGQTANSAPVHVTVNHINHRISGLVIDNITSAPVAGVRIDLVCPSNPAITATTTTAADGSYLFTDLGTTVNDSVTITPTLDGYTFDPTSRSTGYLGYIQNWDNQTFLSSHVNSIGVTLTSPNDGQVFTAPGPIRLSADATTQTGTISKVEFYRGQNVLIGSDTTAPYEFNWTNVPAGFYQLYARATDSMGNQRDSAINVVTVNAAPTTVRMQGNITNAGGGWMPGITVLLSGTVNGQTVNQSAVSNSFGAYGFFSVPIGGDYTITPQGTQMTFTPPSRAFTNVVNDTFDIDFQASANNQPPTVHINSPLDGAVYTMPAEIPVSATATDGDGSVIRLTMAAQSETQFITIGQTLGGNYSALWQPNQPGSYLIWATAVDNGGLQTSVNIHITINPPTAVSLSGRTVDRNSVGIDAATVELRQYSDDQLVATAITDANGNYSIPGIETFRNYVLRASKAEYSFSPRQRVYINLNQTQTGVDFTGTLQLPDSDFDGDAQSDIAVWRPSTGMWYVKRSTDQSMASAQFGNASLGDVIVPGNYDGDKKVDFAVYRSGVWYIRNSSNGSVRTVHFGVAEDKPVPADFDGDGRTDIAVWRPSNGVWYIIRSTDGAIQSRQFGTQGDIPVAADYDGDGMTDIAVWRPGSGYWYILQSTNGAVNARPFGSAGDVPVIGDYDGDKRSDLAVFRPSDGNWYMLRSSDGSPTAIHWGVNGDKPVAGDYDRDGKTDVAIFRPSNGTWYIFKAASGRAVYQQFGVSDDIPVPGVFIR